ncbi:glycosyl transferase, family II [Desulfosarcina variabilis str. Montpellier]|uniref:glycosyltransferase family 2 protein n=1 Tax=Desulfosarcina variabilis TaxID=2300 RepID=UPI003AFA7135
MENKKINYKKRLRPIVSVVVTCYNYGHFLAACLNSVLSQTFKEIEVIVVDDGSTDDSEQVAIPFLKDERVRYIKQKNGGQANAKNRGIREAKGEFIAFLDADDQWDKCKIEKQLPLFEDTSVGVVYSIHRFVDEAGQPVMRQKRRRTMKPRKGKVTQYLFIDNFIPFSSTVVRSDCFNRLGVFDESLAMGIDWDLWLRFSTRYLFDYVDEPLLIYRIGHSGQMSKNVLKRQSCSDRIMDKFRRAYPKEVNASTDRKAMAFTYCNRGEYFRHESLILSTSYYIKSLNIHPLWIPAYKGILKNSMALVIPAMKGRTKD